MDMQQALVEILKQKGIGPTMSKGLADDQVALLTAIFSDLSADLVTKATLWTALRILPANADEARWIDHACRTPGILPPELFQIETAPTGEVDEIVHRLIGENDLNDIQMWRLMDSVLSVECPGYKKAMMLEGLRLKRETGLENSIALAALWQESRRVSVDVPVIELATAYDGMNRFPMWIVFFAPVLASVGLATLLTGVASVGPKFGVTHHQALVLSGKMPVRPLAEVAADISDPSIGWGYADQVVFCPKLAALGGLRKAMVKRPVLSTVEKLLSPIQAPAGNAVVTSFTHPHYRNVMVELISKSNQFSSGLVVRGLEGSIQLPVDRRSVRVVLHESRDDGYVAPIDYGIRSDGMRPDHAVTAEDALRSGLDALRGIPGVALDTIVLGCSIIATSLAPSAGISPDDIRDAIRSGAALDRWNRGR